MKKALHNIQPFKQGKSNLDRTKKILKLSANESPYPPSPYAKKAYQDTWAGVNRYPDASQTCLRTQIANTHNINPDNIIITNGSEEAICLLMRAYLEDGDNIVTSQNGFILTNNHARSCGAEILKAPEKDVKIDVHAMLELVNNRTKILVLCNPNNPTGTYIPFDDVIKLESALPPHVILLLDSAYAEYAELDDNITDYNSGVALWTKNGRVVMTRTFSKSYALSGLRVGWMLAPDMVLDAILRIRTPFNVNVVAQAIATAVLQDDAYMRKLVHKNNTIRAEFCNALNEIGIPYLPSATNFVMLDFMGTGKTGTDAHEYLLENGIICRPQENEAYLRVSIGTSQEMQTTAETLAKFMRS